MAKRKFQGGDRVVANERAPGDYEGRVGMVLQYNPPTSEYQVQFDADERGPGWLASWQLDRQRGQGNTLAGAPAQ